MLSNFFNSHKWTNAGNGCINVEKELDKSTISQILKEENLFQIQFLNNPSSKTMDLLNKHLFSIRSDVYLRLTNYSKPEENLLFLLNMKNLQYLYLDIVDLKSLDLIGKLDNLKGLILSETKTKSYSLKPISNLKNLTSLNLSCLQKDIESLKSLTEIRELTLRSLTLKNLDFLENFHKLEKVKILLGGTKNFTSLTRLSNLKFLEIWQVRQLENIDFISDLIHLEFLDISSLRNIKALPRFSKNVKLKKVYLENLKGLQDISTLEDLKSLEEILYVSANNLQPVQFEVLRECKYLKMASIGFGSDKKNIMFEKFRDSIGVEKFDWKKSMYK